MDKQKSLCALTGLPIHIGNTKHKTTASLDRIDSNKGYIVGNVQWLHKDINRLKTNFDITRFIELCHLISKHNQ